MPCGFGKPACTFDLSVIRLASVIRDVIVYKEVSHWAEELELTMN